ncbi:MAG: HD domain-containing protein, partial [Dehalococcoidales bacterium]|nr:HD domain-containing protein [Dehalococcoidales bacterium]
MLNQRRLVYPTKMNNQNNIRLNQDNIPAGINKDSGDNPSEILQHLQRNSNILRDRYFWYVVILAILMGIFCYAPKLAILAGVAPLPDWEYAFFVAGYRTFYILCVTVAAWRLGILNGIITSVVLALVLFSPLLFTPPAAFNTWLELGVVGFSIIVSFVIGRQGKMQKLLTKTAYELQQQAMQLRLEVNERKKAERDLRTLSLRAMESLVFALEAKDKYTAGHSRRVTDITMCIGNKMCLSKEDLEDLRCGSLLHDVGKIGVDQLIQN